MQRHRCAERKQHVSDRVHVSKREFGCDYAQGYLLGRPVAAEEIVALVVGSEGAIVAV